MSATFHSVVSKEIAEYLEVLRFVHTCVFLYLVEVGECTPLTGLMTYERHRDWCVRHVFAIVCSDVLFEIDYRFWSASCPFVQSTGTSLNSKFATWLPCPTATNGEATIEMTIIVFLYLCYMFG